MFSRFFGVIGGLDFAAFQWLRSYHAPFLDALMAGLSDVSRAGALWMFLGLLIAWMRPSCRPAAVQLLLAVGLSAVLTDSVAKPLFDRARPFATHADIHVQGVRPDTPSFPSGHAANAAAGAYALVRMAPDGRAIFVVLSVLVAYSRVYLGVHYPADILAGVLLGLAAAVFATGGTRWRGASAAVHKFTSSAVH